jgi:hypothetical protein
LRLIKTITVAFLLSFFSFFTSCKKEKDNNLNEVPTAEAGSIQPVQLPIDSVKMTGIGNDVDGKVVAYLWTEVSGPNLAAIVHPGSASTTIKGLIEGAYLFQLMVVDDKGATGVDTLSIKVNPALIQVLNLQTVQNPNEVHIWGNSTNKEGSGPGVPELGASSWTHNGDEIGQRGLFKFDFSSIPSNAIITSAKLTLYSNPTPDNGDLIHANSGTSNAMLIQKITSSWTPSTVKWITQPTSTAQDQIIIPHTNSSFLDLIDINVTNLVKSMVGSNANHGFLIRLQTEQIYNSRIFCSSFYPVASKHPKIVIEYTK